MIPPTDFCPFCEKNLLHYSKIEEYTEVWYCSNCLCETDDDISRYTVLCFDTGNGKAYQQEFTVKHFFVRNNFHGKETKLCHLIGGMIAKDVIIPFTIFDLKNSNDTELLNKFKLYFTFQ